LIEYLDTDGKEEFNNDSIGRFKESVNLKKLLMKDSLKVVKIRYDLDDADKYLNELSDSQSLGYSDYHSQSLERGKKL